MQIRDGHQVAALTIAGSDSGGNAGVQADIRAFHVFGLHACTVFASLTAQNPSGVSGVLVPDVAFLEKQLDAVLPAYAIGAVKTGMLATAEVIRCVASKLRGGPRIPIVVDPVMVATSGAKLLADDAIGTLRTDLLPQARLATPNIPEAEILSGLAIRSSTDMLAAARAIRAEAGCAVLVKGGHHIGHEEGDHDEFLARDVLVCDDGVFRFSSPAIANPASTHGTGCSLSAAIAASLALGHTLPEAVRDGKAYVYESIRTSLSVGPAATVLGTPDLSALDSAPVSVERAS